MKARSLSAATFAVAAVIGCAEIRPDARVGEAIDLVGDHTGHRPGWTAPWDEKPPPWDGTTVLGPDEAVVMALRNNRQLRADLEMIGQANADLVQAGLLQNPMISFMIMFPDGGGRSMLRGTAPLMPLQDLWLIPAREAVAAARLREAVLRVADRAVETAAAVRKTYARLQYTQRAAELIRDNMAVVDQSIRIIHARQAAGRATQVEVNLSQIRHMRLRSELLAIQAEHRGLQRQLLELMGVAFATDQWTVRPVHEVRDPLDAPIAEADLLELAGQQRLDLKAAEWSTLAAGRNIRLVRREGWPDLALGFTFERAPAPRSQNPGLAGQAANAAVQGVSNAIMGMPPTPPMAAPFSPKMREVTYTMGPMLEMEIPIFDYNQAQAAKAVHEFRQRVAEYEARFQEIARMVRETLVMYAQAHEQVRFYRDSILPAAERNVALARQSYVAGREELTVYLQAQEDLLMTRLKLLEFYRDCLVNRAELERQVGGRLVRPGPATRPAGVSTR